MWWRSATSFDDKVWFAGGFNNTVYYNTLHVFDEALTTSTSAIRDQMCNVSASHTKSYALFCGGSTRTSGGSSVVNAFTGNLTRTIKDLFGSCRDLSSGSISDIAIFTGGICNGDWSGLVEGYSDELTHFNITSIHPRYYFPSVSTTNHIIFTGGIDSHDPLAMTDILDASLTHISGSELSLPRYHIGATNIQNNSLFAGGEYRAEYGGDIASIVDIYDDELTHKALDAKTKFHNVGSGITIGDHALFLLNDTITLCDLVYK
ncbi:MAG: hypothetical protein HDQ88_08520 [Clostridia bacterium]|nr:hypothetical protein [Clostridia bacterium]